MPHNLLGKKLLKNLKKYMNKKKYIMLEKINALSDKITGKFYTRVGTWDSHIIKSVWDSNSYLQCGYNISPDDLVIDIGAQIGTFSVLAALQGANVLAFEPHPENYQLLLKNIALNNVANKVTTYEKAILPTAGKEKLWIHPENTGAHTIHNLDHFKKGTFTKFINISSITLNSILKDVKKCDLLKLDCEGDEYSILQNSDLSKVSKISMEWHGKHKLVFDLIRKLTKEGFVITTLLNGYIGIQGILQAKRR